jgi:hypothetical protein
MTSAAGISASSITRAVVSRSCSRRTRSTMNADSARTSRTLPSSDAWNEKNGSWIARREPRATDPSIITSTMLAIRKP